MRRFLTPEEMNTLSDVVERRDIADAATGSEMVDGGYVADFTPNQMAYLAKRFLPTGRFEDARICPMCHAPSEPGGCGAVECPTGLWSEDDDD